MWANKFCGSHGGVKKNEYGVMLGRTQLLPWTWWACRLKEAMRYEKVMKEAKTRRLQLEIQLETMRQRTMRINGALDMLEKIWREYFIIYCGVLYLVY